MSHYEVVIGRCKRLERVLEDRFGATGRGLHEKVSSVAGELPPALVKRMRFIATVRNKLVHEDEGNTIADLAGYKSACDQAEAEIDRLTGVKHGGWGKTVLVVVALLVILAGLVFVLMR